jgi:hypothetical protein
MIRLPAICVVAVLVTGVFAPRADASSTYAHTLVAPAVRTGEPKIFVDSRTRPATIYLVAPDSSTRLWRSTDGGKTFREMAATAGGSGDSDVVVDEKGTLYASDLISANGQFSFPISTSLNRGRSWARIVELAAPTASLDREWIASNAAGHVLGTALDTNTGSLLAWVSTDAALTFDGPFTVARNISIQGPIVTAPGHIYWTIYGAGDGLHYARSRDGVSWNTGLIAPAHAPSLFPVIAADRSSNLFAVWTESVTAAGGPVYFTKSTNGGRTWSRPAALSPTRPDAFGTTPATIFPWVVANAKGKVAVSYAIARQLLGPDLGPDAGGPQTSWDYVVQQSSNALAPRPAWSSTVVAKGFHVGSICTIGTGCVGPQQFGLLNVPTPFDRRDLDFAGAGVDASGNVYLGYNQDRPLTSGDPNDIVRSRTNIDLARQTGGQRLR